MDLSPGFKDHWQYIYSQHSVLHFKWSDGEVLINSNELSRNINKVPNSQIKIGRLVQSLLKNSETEFTRQIEQFVDKYKAEIQIMGDVLIDLK
jgi:sulfatase maturation enzyme AslB (radical SAM superfamily)